VSAERISGEKSPRASKESLMFVHAPRGAIDRMQTWLGRPALARRQLRDVGSVRGYKTSTIKRSTRHGSQGEA
jgi:ribosomal protein L34